MTAKKQTQAVTVEPETATGAQNGAQAGPESVAMILQSAGALGMSAEDVSKMLDIHLKLEARKEERAFLAAFSRFQEECPEIHKLDDAHNGKYAKLPRIAKAIRPAMKANGLSFRHEIEDTDKGLRVTCIVSHVDGHKVSTSMSAASDTSGAKSAIQAAASTVTYLERYTLGAALGIVAGDADNDGDADKDPPAVVNAAQLATLKQLIADSGSDAAGLMATVGCDSLATFPSDRYAWAEAVMVKRIAKANKGQG